MTGTKHETHAHEEGGHSCCSHHGHHEAITPLKSAQYFCPMCEGVVSDKPGACPHCGMALERNPTYAGTKRTVYTCPMHPQVQEDHPGACTICGMALEPSSASETSEEENGELYDMGRRFWIGLALTI